MDLHDTLKTYRLFSGSYDSVFGPLLHPGRKEAVALVNDRPMQRILEVGVGTGLSLPYFRTDAKVTGIDVSAEMLAKARARVAKKRLQQVEALLEMNAENLLFADNSFDAVVALYVASVVPEPARFAAEMRRVCRPQGTILIVNHFTSENWVMRRLEKALAPLAGKIGFEADFPLDNFLKVSHLEVREARPSNLFGYWTLLKCVNTKPAYSEEGNP
ncbi:MAG TPA: class I SAM-dependent methyltransferase [Stellaceae bacterium]|nr:class I SAM-dependent methyltransferase [Stellaceae bacterium]